MKWIGQHIYDLVAKFRNTVDFSKDVTFYQPINDADPNISIGASDDERLEIKILYQGTTTQSLQQAVFSTFTESGTADDGIFTFVVDGATILDFRDAGIYLRENMGISINGTDILTDSSGTATLSNIDAIDATTKATLESALTDSTTDSLVIDTDRSAAQGNAGAEDITALHVDFDRIVPSSGTYAHNDKGIALDVTSASLGTSTLYGMDINVTGATTGTSIATGIDLLVHRADTNYGIVVQSADTQLKLVQNGYDYATFTVADTGDLTIATVGDGTTDSDLTLDADGQIKLEPASGSNILLDGTIAIDAGVVTGATSITSTAFVGDVTGDLTGDASGSSGSCTGQAATVATIAGLAPNTATTQATQPNIDSIGTDGDTLGILGDKLQMYNTTTNKPEIELQNRTDDATGPIISFTNNRQDSGTQAGEDDDVLGKMLFYGYDDQGTPAIQTYASITADIHDATSGEESGRLTFQVANHDGDGGSGLILTGGSADNEIDVTVGLGAGSAVVLPGSIEITGNCDIGANSKYKIDGTDIISDSSGTATLSNIDALDATTKTTIATTADAATASATGVVELATTAEAITGTDTARAVTPAGLKARVSQIVNLKGYAVLQNDVYDYANAYNTDDEAPFQLDVSYGSGTIDSSTEVAQSKLFRSGGFHVPFACTVSALQTQVTCNNAGNVSIALVEYRPSDTSGDANDYPRTVYETVVNASDNNNNKVDTVTIAAGDLDNTAVPAGSHLMIMVKGDGTSVGGTTIISVAIGLSW